MLAFNFDKLNFQYADSFEESRVDGDLLLQLSEDMLREDIEMRNGILRRRFLRELTNLKRMADYSSCDATNLNGFLQVYYSMILGYFFCHSVSKNGFTQKVITQI
jgi:hypothetical protein